MKGYPYGLDYGWLACDASGQVAIFTSAGEAPIPVTVIMNRPSADTAETLVETLPERGSCEELGANPHAWAVFAVRGLFAYDWQDIHRIIVKRSDHYELMARPNNPIVLDELPLELRMLARLACFDAIRFSDNLKIAVHNHLRTWPDKNNEDRQLSDAFLQASHKSATSWMQDNP